MPALSVSGGRRSTRDCSACAPCRAGCDRPIRKRRAQRRRDACLPRRALVVRRASCGLQRQASAPVLRAAAAGAPALAVSGWKRSTRACCARAPCRAGWDRPMRVRRAMHQRKTCPLRRAPVVRRVSCGFQRQASAACLARRRRACARCLGVETQHSSLLCARRAALVVISPYGNIRALRPRVASLLRRTPVVRRPSCGLQRQASAAGLARRRRACARCLGVETQHSSLLCARRTALVVIGPYENIRALRRRVASLHRRAPVVRRVSCGLQRQASAPALGGEGAPALAVLGRRRSTRACCSRAPCRAGCDRPIREYEDTTPA